MAAHNARNLKPLTYRVETIPPGMSPEELKKCFYSEDQDYLKVKSLCPSVETEEDEEGDLTATVYFHPPQRQNGPRIATSDMITVDKEFHGFTPLYVPPKEKGHIVAE
jgi:hypothetical protein